MNNRLLQFINAENLSQSQFADSIGVARASVSHILSGRNKPGFDFIEGMSRHYPALNLEWLITGKGKMYKGQQDLKASAPQEDEDDLFAHLDETPAPAPPAITGHPSSPETQTIQQKPESSLASGHSSPCGSTAAPLPQRESARESERQISKIIIFFSDNTFQELK